MDLITITFTHSKIYWMKLFILNHSLNLLSHIYKERNEVVDFLSKEATQLIQGQWIIQQYRNGDFFHAVYREGSRYQGLSLHQSTFWGLTTLFSFSDFFLHFNEGYCYIYCTT